MKDYHSILGLQPGASKEEIKKSYRALAKQHHPDLGGDQEKFKEISEAYNYLIKEPEQSADDFYGDFSYSSAIIDSFMSQFGASRTQKPPQNDEDIQISFGDVSVADIKRGVSGKVKYKRSKECDACHGSLGKEKKSCTSCNGAGIKYGNTRSSNTSIRTFSICDSCFGKKFTIIDPCKPCKALGFIVFEETIDIEIKEKK